MKHQLLVDRIAGELSYEAAEALRHAGVWIDQSKTGTTEQLISQLQALGVVPTQAMIDFEQRLGGATTRSGTVYGIINCLLLEAESRATSVCLATSGGAPRLFASGELQKHPEAGLYWVRYDSAVHHVEVEYLVAPSLERHTVSFPSLLGNALAEVFAFERFEPACGSEVSAWRGYDQQGSLWGLLELSPWSTAELDREWTEGYTAVLTESADAVVAVLDWAERNKYLARWSGPMRHPKKSQRLAARYLMPQWVDAWRTDVEVSVWGAQGNYCITRVGGREW